MKRAICMLAVIVGAVWFGLGYSPTPSTANVFPVQIHPTFDLNVAVDHVDQTVAMTVVNGPANQTTLIEVLLTSTESDGTLVTHQLYAFIPTDAFGFGRIVATLSTDPGDDDFVAQVRALFVDSSTSPPTVFQAASTWQVSATRVADASDIQAADPAAYVQMKRAIADFHGGGASMPVLSEDFSVPPGVTNAFRPDSPTSSVAPALQGPGGWFNVVPLSSGPAGVFTVN